MDDENGNLTDFHHSRILCPYVSFYHEDSQSYRNNLLAVGIANTILMIPGIFLNAVVILAFLRSQSLRQGSYRIFLSLSISDFLSSVIVQSSLCALVFITTFQEKHQFPCPIVLVTSLVGYTLAGISLSTVCFIALERYFAIFHPFIHVRIFSGCLVISVIITIWLATTAVMFYCIFGNNRLLFFVVNTLVISTTYLWTIYVYLKIWKRAWKITTAENDLKNRLEVRSARLEFKATRVVGPIIWSILLCYLLQIIVALCRTIGGQNRIIDHFIEFWAFTFGLLNCSLNPIVYCHFNPEIRIRVLRQFGSRIGRPSVGISTL